MKEKMQAKKIPPQLSGGIFIKGKNNYFWITIFLVTLS